MKGSPANEIIGLRTRAAVLSVLSKLFLGPEQTLERRILASNAFVVNVVDPVIKSTGVDGVVGNRLLVGKTIADHFTDRSRISLPSECKWLVERIEVESMRVQSPLAEGRSPFPSILSRTGPQFPFKPWEFRRLRDLAGSLKGPELSREIRVKSRAKKIDKYSKPELARDLKEFCSQARDDTDDMKIDLVNPKFF